MKRGLKFYLGLIPLGLLALISFQNCGPSFKSLNSEGQAFSVAAGNDANNNQDDCWEVIRIELTSSIIFLMDRIPRLLKV